MQLKYLATLVEQQDGAAKIAAMHWSPNGRKLAIVNADQVILLFDESGKRRDKFATKPVDAKNGKKSYQVKAMIFSPDSSRIAVGQTDNITYIYRVGEMWNEKKVICNKFLQTSAVTSLLWPNEDRLIIGLLEGKAFIELDTFLIRPSARSFISGHSDGSVILFSMEHKTQNKILTHNCPPYALVYTNYGIIIGGCDQRIVSYTESGRILQQFNYRNCASHEKEFTVGIRNTTGQCILFGSFDRVRLYSWNVRRGALDECKPFEIRYLYTISALAWNPTGATIALGTLCGAVITLDCCLKRSVLKGHFQAVHISPSQIILKSTANDLSVSMHSTKELSIADIKVMGRDRYAVAYTASTLIIADLSSGRCSEIEWQSAGNEKFYFDYENVCMIVNAGEISLVEYGKKEITGWIRTELTSPHLISARFLEHKTRNAHMVKRVAYLLDLNTISVVDMISQRQLAQYSHSVFIDWLELSEMANKLLFRDRRSRLILIDLITDRKVSLLNYCNYVQWVPDSDVIVAQSSDQLCVWYQAENPDQIVMVPIKGEIETVLRDEFRTEVIVEETNAKVAYELDQTLIEFASAIDRLDLGRAVDFLERRSESDTSALWRQLSQIALSEKQLLIAQRSFAALGDISRVEMLWQTIRIADEVVKIGENDGKQNYKNALDEAIEMYRKIGKWEEGFELAYARNHPNLDALKAQYCRYLSDTGQDAKAAQISERDGDLMSAIDLYLKASFAVQAARILLQNPKLLCINDLVEKVVAALVRSDLFEKAGELLEAIKNFEHSLQNYKQGKCYAKAIQLARVHFPEEVILLEEEWGDHLMEKMNYDAAISHFLESGQTLKALEASMKAGQWSKAAQIANSLEDSHLAKQYYGKIADYYASIGDLEQAEMLYVEAKMHQEAIEMYNKAARWTDSYRLAVEFMGEEESAEVYGKLAESMEENDRRKDAEELYIATGQVNKAITMYQKAQCIDDMLKLIEKYHVEDAKNSHVYIATDLEQKGDLRAAEEHYLLGGEWKLAVNMYQNAELWNDAYRVAKQEGEELAQNQVIYRWAKSLNAEAAVKLLRKFKILDESINYACDNRDFDFAFYLCRSGAKNRLSGVHMKLAQQLEEEGSLKEAEVHYIEGGKSKEAVMMYVHDQDWESAERIAKEYCPDMLAGVYIQQARLAIEEKDFPRAESCLLRADRPELILHYYKEFDMWQDAIRIAKDYLPIALEELEEQFDQVQLKSGAKGAISFMAQARKWETEGEYVRAVECYLKVKDADGAGHDVILDSLKRAGELAVKFLPEQKASAVIDSVAEGFISFKRLLIESAFKVFSDLRFLEAGELFLTSNRPESAVKAFLLAGQWTKAKKVAMELAPEMVGFVDEKFKESLKNEGRFGELINVDVIDGIEALVEQGEWIKALETARQHKHQPLLDKYVALYAFQLIKDERFFEAIEVFEKFGASSNPNNFHIYQKLIEKVINGRDMNDAKVYTKWASLRNMLFMICEDMVEKKTPTDQIFGRYLEIAHYGALRSALLSYGAVEMENVANLISISLIRYCDIMQADKVFYEAGMACKKQSMKKERLAFLLLNYYLDLCDAIEDQNPSSVDGTIFQGTDIPQEVPLPQAQFTTNFEHEEVKEWVLAMSVDQNMEQGLPLDNNGNFEVSLLDASSHLHPACIISGYPTYGTVKEFGSSKVADLNTWNHLIMKHKTKPTENITDVLQFIAKWTHTSTSLSL
ncbi:unnamed protein product [Thelazia callipaeda]|uniref:Intraflagellar transport protein 172 homolog n=1 Tax=Thelazia callipaeda TaxID=103827 RepID=A0A158RB93_THECL|nr:unnamed protein product [Thelazia callipaeda]